MNSPALPRATKSPPIPQTYRGGLKNTVDTKLPANPYKARNLS